MKRLFLTTILIIASIYGFSQEKTIVLDFGINRMKPSNTGSGYEPLIGIQAGILELRKISNSFSYDKGFFLTYTSFEEKENNNTLLLKNSTFSLSIPFQIYWTKVSKYFKPFVGAEAIWRFSSNTNYFEANIPQNEVSKLQLGLIIGTEILLYKQISLNVKYLTTPYLISYGTMDLNGFLISVRYKFKQK